LFLLRRKAYDTWGHSGYAPKSIKANGIKAKGIKAFATAKGIGLRPGSPLASKIELRALRPTDIVRSLDKVKLLFIPIQGSLEKAGIISQL
jgi:hypothetical protein